MNPSIEVAKKSENDKGRNITWSIIIFLLSFLILSQTFVLMCFITGIRLFSWVLPLSIVFSCIATFVLFYYLINHKSDWLKIFIPCFSIIIISIIIAGLFYDMSWDGLWYHQTAVYQMAKGWNPVYDPLHNFTPHLQDWVRHYAKGQWYTAFSIYSFTGDIEYAKAATWIAMIISFFAVYTVSSEYRFKRWQAILTAGIVSLNPVVVFELASFLVDGLMISFLTIFTAAIFSWYKNPNKINTTAIIFSAILCICTKQTGLVYLCFASSGTGIFILIMKRQLFMKFLFVQIMSLTLGVLIFGYNPYVTNTITRGNPFYPMLGSQNYPGLAAQGEDPIEKWETPHNMMGTSRLTRLSYAIFGRPGAQPYYPNSDASYMIPFDLTLKDFSIYYFHDVRISGFGPLFSVIFLISLFLLAISVLRTGISKTFLIVVLFTIVSSLLISEHTWWARYGPQLWWIPVLALIISFFMDQIKKIKFAGYVLIVVMLVNMIPIYFVHFKWETEATRQTNEQIRMLKNYDNITVDFQYFGEPFGERLKAAGISFRTAQKLECNNPIEIISVSLGYPCAVRVCLK